MITTLNIENKSFGLPWTFAVVDPYKTFTMVTDKANNICEILHGEFFNINHQFVGTPHVFIIFNASAISAIDEGLG